MKILELNQLEKKFGENKVLKGINLVANKGDVVSCLLYTSDAADD